MGLPFFLLLLVWELFLQNCNICPNGLSGNVRGKSSSLPPFLQLPGFTPPPWAFCSPFSAHSCSHPLKIPNHQDSAPSEFSHHASCLGPHLGLCVHGLLRVLFGFPSVLKVECPTFRVTGQQGVPSKVGVSSQDPR